ncbi:MAG: ketoacyl-ACP synthase III [Magnetococcales bacterium]|nr:ketoacyl-ACP synthase III [Magnetococcales bacterium]
MSHSRIIATGSYLPSRILTNHELATMVDTSDEWIRSRSGIEERRIAAEGELTSDLATAAARQALQAASLTPDDLDLIVVGTTTPDLLLPSTAALVQYKLGATRRFIPAFDVNAACTGFMYCLSIADQMLASGPYRRALVIGAETFSRIVDWTDRATCVLFGDGAGAVILEKCSPDAPSRILSTHIHADGTHHDLLKSSGGASTGLVAGAGNGPSGVGAALMKGNEVYKHAVTVLGRIVDETLQANGLDRSHVDWLVPHQANIRIIQSTAKKLHMDMSQVVVTVHKHGNTSAASVPLALDVAVRDGRIQAGQLVLLEAFGGGFTWGSALVRW